MKEGVIAMPRRLVELFLQRKLSISPVASGRSGDTPTMVDEKSGLGAIEQQGLFVLGAARSGTTVLQNALNDSREIFLFGEPSFHDDMGTADFATRYNYMHRAWGNQENKSSFCPPFFSGDAIWSDYLCHLATLYRYVGSKIVINPEKSEETCQRIFDFHCRHFYRAYYIFTFRNPIDVLMSTRGLAELNGDTAASYGTVLRSFVGVVALYIRMLRNLPSVSAVFHESVTAKVFHDIGAELGVDLSSALHYYDSSRARHYTLNDIPEEAWESTKAVVDLYENLRQHALTGFESVQLEQNSGHLDIRHYTPIGALQRQVEQLLRRL